MLGITEHPQDTASPCTDQKPFLSSFSTAFWSKTGRKKQSGRKRVEKVDINCIWSIKDKTILLECSVMLNYQLKIVGERICDFYWSFWRIFCKFTFRPLYLSTDVHTYGLAFLRWQILLSILVVILPFAYSNVHSICFSQRWRHSKFLEINIVGDQRCCFSRCSHFIWHVAWWTTDACV